MPTPEIFDAQPPFPGNLPVYNLPAISHRKLLSNDLSESHRLFQACKQVGFFQLDLRETTNGECFVQDAKGILDLNVKISALNVLEKSEYITKPPFIFGEVLPFLGALWWKAPGKTKLEDGREDRCEFYSISQDSVLGTSGAQKNPVIVNSSSTLLKSFMLRAHGVSILILSHLNKQLKLSEGLLASLHPISKPSMTTVRLIQMSPQPEQDRSTSLFGHTDNGSITILFNIISGLQILPPDAPMKESNWRWIRPEAGCAIINLGDTLVQWTGGILRSCFHRVVSPASQQADYDRFSFAYVLKPDNEAPMQTLTALSDETIECQDDRYIYKD